MLQGSTALRRRARDRLDDELRLIDELGLAGFFLLHWEVLELAREVAVEVRGRDSPRRFLPPGRGRGSSVGSIVCYLTGLSHVDPVAHDLSLGRFLNRELASVPDIDLDFPRDIREKLIVAVTERYGREHAALVATFATYRSRGAIRDVGKALGLPHAELERLARLTDGWDARRVAEEVASLPDAERKLESRRWRAFQYLTAEIAGLPRHVSQHPGGMVISSRPLVELVPVQPAAMAGRQLCQWDKDSCADAGFLKIDLLGLGMLSAVEDCVERIARPAGRADRPLPHPARRPGGVPGDPGRGHGRHVPDREPRTDAEPPAHPAGDDRRPHRPSRARPARARSRGRPCTRTSTRGSGCARTRTYVWPVDHELLREPLRATYGVVVFQDQVLDVAIALAGFTVGEAEGLRRAMSRKRSHEALEAYRERFVEGAAGNDVDAETANRVYDKLVGFSGFGFPKSHAAAFGLLAYQSAWLRHHYPAVFLCALLNAQPMGFYPPASLVRDAQRRGVEVLSARGQPERGQMRAGDRCRRCLSPSARSDRARVRLLARGGRRGDDSSPSVKRTGRSATSPTWRAVHPFRRMRWRRSSGAAPATCSARAGATCSGSSGSSSAHAAFQARAVRRSSSRSRSIRLPRRPSCRDLTRWERMLADYRHTGLSVGTHPLALLRPHLPQGTLSSEELHDAPHGSERRVRWPGDRAPATLDCERDRLHAARGRARTGEPDRAAGDLRAAPRDVVRGEPLLLVRGRYERVDRNRNVLVAELESLAPLARRVAEGDVAAALPRAHHFGHR